MKKLLTSLLCVMMVVCMMPAMAWADGETMQNPVAQIGDITYPDLQTAVNAAGEGQTVTLLTDASIDEKITISKSLIIDLNDKTLTGEVDNFMFNNEGAVTVTVRNGHIVSEVSGFSWDDKAKLTLENVKIESNEGRGIYIRDAEVVVDKDSEVKSNGGEEPVYIHVASADGSENPVLNLYGTLTLVDLSDEDDPYSAIGTKGGNPTINIYESAKIQSSDCGIYLQQKATLNIYGGDIAGDTAAVKVEDADSDISIKVVILIVILKHRRE